MKPMAQPRVPLLFLDKQEQFYGCTWIMGIIRNDLPIQRHSSNHSAGDGAEHGL